LLAISRRQFRTLTQPGLEGVEAHRTQKKVFGQPRSIVVTFNQNLARPANSVATPPGREGERRQSPNPGFGEKTNPYDLSLEFEEREEALLQWAHSIETGQGGGLPLALATRIDNQSFSDAA
jgi:hypothetical protein